MREESQLSVKIICLVTITLCCLYAGPSAHESAQFWLWLVLVVFVIMAFIAFTVSYFYIFVKPHLSLHDIMTQVRFLMSNFHRDQITSNLAHPFMIAQLTTIGW